jgi:hypothetical protein
MTLIEHIEVGSGGTTAIVLDNIPQTYTDIMVLVSVRNSGNGPDIAFKFNNNTSNFTNRYLYGTGSSASSGTVYGNFLAVQPNSYTGNTFANCSMYVANFTSSNAKSVSIDSVSENNATGSWQIINAALWNDTTAIDEITIYQVSNETLAQYSSVTIYGITAGSDGTTAVS